MKRAAARQHLVEDRAKREQIRAVIDRQSAHLLGRHVADGAEHDARLRSATQHCRRRALAVDRRALLRQFGQTEVENLDAVVPGDEEVLGLEIAMDDALVVRRRESARDLKRILDRLARRQRAAARAAPAASRLRAAPTR